ncbi:hypothetical protein CISIN_1g037865mg [Citrus sinensis]|uniref:TTF-type domain-containing protein n=1 Tax=Citrus sinensis TaxID=2711 RepID=A0A067D3T3_CITSI|nr:hypothetical protein CISIN_1g037865mg [Citrus sinensis]
MKFEEHICKWVLFNLRAMIFQFGYWLEYSIVKDATFCLYCYVFKEENGSQGPGPCFTGEGFRNWKKKEMLRQHVGGVNSAHNIARRHCKSLMNQKAHVATFFFNHSKKFKKEYRLCLTAIIDCIRFLLRQGLAFCGNNESQNVIFNNAPANLQMISTDIQKQIVSVCLAETSKAIIKEIGDSLFSVMIDESHDISTKEQMAVVLRYVDKRGHVVERFIGIKHVIDTKDVSVKASLDILFARHGLSMSRLRGQGYDGTGNMQGELNGLKTLVLKENESAYYIYCFAHLLQLAFLVAKVFNIVAASSKRSDIHREKHVVAVIEALKMGELKSEQVNTDLLLCFACLCPKDSFVAFNKEKLLRLAQLYPKDFSQVDLMALDTQLDVYIMNMHYSVKFSKLNGIGDLAQKMVETNKHKVFSLVYLLVTLALLLPVATATATVERVFSAMNYVKNRQRSRMGDEWLNDNLVVYIEKDVFDCIDNETIL